MSFEWGADITSACDLYRRFPVAGLNPRRIYFYGFTIGQWGFGFVVSRRVP